MATVLKTDRPEAAPQASGLKWIGTRQPRPDGVDKVTGRARFGADISLPGMLVGKVLRSRCRTPASSRSTSPRPRRCRGQGRDHPRRL